MTDIVDYFSKDFDFSYSKNTDLEDFDEENFKLRSKERKGAYFF
jgi:hypothetical protein